ncbi:MAG: hypothetical protein Q9226_004915 [Calogaya cf. arnoldii]
MSKMSQAHILRLSNEMLIHIIANLKHDDLESFSGSCKDTHSLCKEAMALHRQNKRRYTLLETPNPPVSKKSSTSKYMEPSMEVISDALNNDGHLGGYIQRLILRNAMLPSTVADALEQLLKSLKSSHSICNHQQHTAQCPCVAYTEYDLRDINTLLFAASTRLKYLELDRHAVLTITTYIFLHPTESPGIGLPAVLQSLDTVLVGRLRGSGPDRDVDLEDILPFSGLPNIQTIQVHHLVDKQSDPLRDKTSCFPPASTTSLIKLELFNSLISAQGLALMLTPSKINTLEHFTYEVNPGPDYKIRQYDWDPRSIVRELRTNALESLTHLTMIGSSQVKIMGQRSCGGFIGSLRQFTKLRHVHLECYTLIFKRRIRGNPILSADQSDETSFSDPPTQSILELLPPSLETLKLVRREQVDLQMERMLEGVMVGCEALPRLKEVKVKRKRGYEVEAGILKR